MKLGIAVCLLWLSAQHLQASQHHVLIVSGIGGTDSYRQQFSSQAKRLKQAALNAGIDKNNIVLLSAQADNASVRPADKSTLLQAIIEIGAKSRPADRIFVILFGHGNARGETAMFNLPGPDISADELASVLTSFDQQQLTVINTASASGPFIKPLSGNNRIVITATSSSHEFHAPVFGEYFVSAFEAAAADRDKDQRISMLEAFDFARSEVRRDYDSKKRLLVEHGLLDDNSDGEGSLEPGEFEADGALAHRIYLQQPPSVSSGASRQLISMLRRKQTLEESISNLKRQRARLAEERYYDQLERLLVDLALLSRQIRAEGG